MNDMIIERAAPADAAQVYALYHSLIDTPYSTWSEDYPDCGLVEEDVLHGKTLVMRAPAMGIAAAIALLPVLHFGPPGPHRQA